MEGIFSRGLAFLEKSSCLTSLSLLRLLVRSYESTTNLSVTSKHATSVSSPDISRASRTGVSSGNMFHTFHAVLIPLLLKAETVSTVSSA